MENGLGSMWATWDIMVETNSLADVGTSLDPYFRIVALVALRPFVASMHIQS
jgi:hypothetical protein